MGCCIIPNSYDQNAVNAFKFIEFFKTSSTSSTLCLKVFVLTRPWSLFRVINRQNHIEFRPLWVVPSYERIYSTASIFSRQQNGQSYKTLHEWILIEVIEMHACENEILDNIVPWPWSLVFKSEEKKLLFMQFHVVLSNSRTSPMWHKYTPVLLVELLTWVDSSCIIHIVKLNNVILHALYT